MIWRLVTRNFGWKVGSLALAVLLWLSIVGEPELVTIQSVPVFYINLAPNLELNTDAPGAVKLQLRGPSGVLNRENLSGVTVLLDLSGADTAGERIVPVASAKVTLPEGVTLVRTDPKSLKFRLDPVTEEKGNSVLNKTAIKQ
jgi:hypothetical protein